MNEGHERLPLDWIESINIHYLQFVERFVEAVVGAKGLFLGFVLSDEVGSIGPSGTIGEAFDAMVVQQSLERMFAQRTKD